MPDGGGPAQLPSLSLHNLRELQLLMFGLEAVNLAELYAFLKACPCPNLERLFVQVSTFNAFLNVLFLMVALSFISSASEF